MKFLKLHFIPQSTDFGLLLLRIWTGLTLLLNHGYGKLMNFSDMTEKFPDILGIGRTPALVLIIFAEVICSAMLVLGWYTRFAALALSIAMGVAFALAHGYQLSGPGSGELPFLYLGVFVTLLFAGAGRFSIDGKQGA